MTRPEGKHGDTGALWAGMHRTASESLVWATRDDDARCVVVASKEAIEFGRQALLLAKNGRQSKATDRLLDAAHEIKAEAEAVLKTGNGVMP